MMKGRGFWIGLVLGAISTGLGSVGLAVASKVAIRPHAYQPGRWPTTFIA